jgi:hypothetical protein
MRTLPAALVAVSAALAFTACGDPASDDLVSCLDEQGLHMYGSGTASKDDGPEFLTADVRPRKGETGPTYSINVYESTDQAEDEAAAFRVLQPKADILIMGDGKVVVVGHGMEGDQEAIEACV